MSYINTYQSQVYICPLSLKPPIPSHISRLSQRPDLSSLSHIGNLGALLNSDEKCLTAWLAQSVEHGTLNPRAVGSRPTLSSCSSTFGASLVAQLVKNLLAMRETCIRFLDWKIPWRSDRLPIPIFLGFPGSSACKESACIVGDLGSIPGLGGSPEERERLLAPVFWPREFHGLYSRWGCKESDTTEWLSLSLSRSAWSLTQVVSTWSIILLFFSKYDDLYLLKQWTLYYVFRINNWQNWRSESARAGKILQESSTQPLLCKDEKNEDKRLRR